MLNIDLNANHDHKSTDKLNYETNQNKTVSSTDAIVYRS